MTHSYFLIFKDCVTSSFIPVKPFNVVAPPEPTVEVEEFVYDSTKYCRPYRVYKNQIYVYPKHLKYDSQRCFNKVWYVFFLRYHLLSAPYSEHIKIMSRKFKCRVL